MGQGVWPMNRVEKPRTPGVLLHEHACSVLEVKPKAYRLTRCQIAMTVGAPAEKPLCDLRNVAYQLFDECRLWPFAIINVRRRFPVGEYGFKRWHYAVEIEAAPPERAVLSLPMRKLWRIYIGNKRRGERCRVAAVK